MLKCIWFVAVANYTLYQLSYLTVPWLRPPLGRTEKSKQKTADEQKEHTRWNDFDADEQFCMQYNHRLRPLVTLLSSIAAPSKIGVK